MRVGEPVEHVRVGDVLVEGHAILTVGVEPLQPVQVVRDGRPAVVRDAVVPRRAGTPRGYALIADQTPPREEKKHWTRFLNRDTAFFVGAEKIARFLDAPVLYVDMRRVRRGHYAVRFVPLLPGQAREL